MSSITQLLVQADVTGVITDGSVDVNLRYIRALWARGDSCMPEFLAPTRDPSGIELEWFRRNPHIGGYAAEDDRVVVNPYSRLSPSENEALIRNESARIFMRRNYSARPTAESFPLTEAQRGYAYPASPGPVRPEAALRETMAARVLTGDPSVGQTTPQQARFVEELEARMMMARREAAGGE